MEANQANQKKTEEMELALTLARSELERLKHNNQEIVKKVTLLEGPKRRQRQRGVEVEKEIEMRVKYGGSEFGTEEEGEKVMSTDDQNKKGPVQYPKKWDGRITPLKFKRKWSATPLTTWVEDIQSMWGISFGCFYGVAKNMEQRFVEHVFAELMTSDDYTLFARSIYLNEERNTWTLTNLGRRIQELAPLATENERLRERAFRQSGIEDGESFTTAFDRIESLRGKTKIEFQARDSDLRLIIDPQFISERRAWTQIAITKMEPADVEKDSAVYRRWLCCLEEDIRLFVLPTAHNQYPAKPAAKGSQSANAEKSLTQHDWQKMVKAYHSKMTLEEYVKQTTKKEEQSTNPTKYHSDAAKVNMVDVSEEEADPRGDQIATEISILYNDIEENDVMAMGCYTCGNLDHQKKGCTNQEKVCFTCKTAGHFARDCPSKKKEEEIRANKCDFCQKEGHLESSCFRKHPELLKAYGMKRSQHPTPKPKQKVFRARNYAMWVPSLGMIPESDIEKEKAEGFDAATSSGETIHHIEVSDEARQKQQSQQSEESNTKSFEMLAGENKFACEKPEAAEEHVRTMGKEEAPKEEDGLSWTVVDSGFTAESYSPVAEATQLVERNKRKAIPFIAHKDRFKANEASSTHWVSRQLTTPISLGLLIAHVYILINTWQAGAPNLVGRRFCEKYDLRGKDAKAGPISEFGPARTRGTTKNNTEFINIHNGLEQKMNCPDAIFHCEALEVFPELSKFANRKISEKGTDTFQNTDGTERWAKYENYIGISHRTRDYQILREKISAERSRNFWDKLCNKINNPGNLRPGRIVKLATRNKEEERQEKKPVETELTRNINTEEPYAGVPWDTAKTPPSAEMQQYVTELPKKPEHANRVQLSHIMSKEINRLSSHNKIADIRRGDTKRGRAYQFISKANIAQAIKDELGSALGVLKEATAGLPTSVFVERTGRTKKKKMRGRIVVDMKLDDVSNDEKEKFGQFLTAIVKIR